jgi:hypothetical protein
MGTTFIEDELLKRSSSGILTPMRAGDVIQSPGLEDLIAGKTPTLVDWTVNPTDAADITDGDISTFCDTGSVDAAAWQSAYFEWDLGAFYHVLCSGVGSATATAGTSHTFIDFWDGAAWKRSAVSTSNGAAAVAFVAIGALCSKVRIALTASAIATVAPNIRDFHAWRL